MPSALFSPLHIGAVELVNRLVVAPMCQYSAADGSATDWHLQHLAQLGYSGAGLVVVEATGVERRGRITHGCLGLYSDENEAALGRVLAAARRLAGPARFAIQLAHAGRKGSTLPPWQAGKPLRESQDPWTTVAPSALAFDEGWHVPMALTVEAIKAVTASFALAAQRAARLGFDVVELHSAHGYLIHEFLSPLSNHRSDQYGGSLENRMRFGLETLAAIRDVLPGSMALGMRISSTDWVEGGWTIDDSVEYVRAAQRIGVDYICASSGGNRTVRIPTAPGYQVQFAQKIRQATGVTTRAVGLITEPMQAEQILADGQADLIALARAFLDDPRWGWHAADRLGATVHCPPQYERVRIPEWLKTKNG